MCLCFKHPAGGQRPLEAGLEGCGSTLFLCNVLIPNSAKMGGAAPHDGHQPPLSGFSQGAGPRDEKGSEYGQHVVAATAA